MQKTFGQKSATFSDYFFANTNERNNKSENPVKTTGKVKQRKLTLKQYGSTDHLVTKSGKPKLRKANQNCPSRKYSKMNELVKKVTDYVDLGKISDFPQLNLGPYLGLDSCSVALTLVHKVYVTCCREPLQITKSQIFSFLRFIVSKQ